MKGSKTRTDGKRGKRGNGRLYIRTKDRRQLPAGTSNHDGYYWLEYWHPTGKDDARGKPIKKKRRVKLADADGKPITKLKDAEDARDLILNQHVKAETKDRLAVLKAELEEATLEHAEAVEVANPPLKIDEAWEQFEDHPKLDCGATLLYNYRSHWNQFLEWLGDHDPDAVFMRDISSKTAQAYVRHLKKRKVSPSTFNKHINFLKLMFTTLRDEIRCESQPFADIATRKLAKAKAKASARQRKRRELTLDELVLVLDNAEGDLQTLLMMGAYFGLRLGDCCTLRWNEVDLVGGLVRRVPNKTQGDPIKIGVPPRLIQRLSETPKTKRRGYVLPQLAEDYTYATDAGKHSHRTRITNRIQKHFEEVCGISIHAEGTGYRLEPDPEREGKYIKVSTGRRAVVEVGFHSLRHTFVSMQAGRGVPQAVIQKIVGHGSPAMTAHYTHISDQDALGATLMLGEGVVREMIPEWATELIRALDTKNVAEIKKQLMEVK